MQKIKLQKLKLSIWFIKIGSLLPSLSFYYGKKLFMAVLFIFLLPIA